MTFVSMTNLLNKALLEKYAVGQFNVYNVEWAQAILAAAEEEKSPVILGIGEAGIQHFGGLKTIYMAIKGLIEDMNITIPVVLHLDHGASFDKCKSAIDIGYSSVMIDASHLPLKENMDITRKVVNYAHAYGVSVEAELGSVGGHEDGVISEGIIYADTEECTLFVQTTNIDCLAPALGSVHGPYKGEPNLGFKEMEDIKNATKIPLSLHGGTGISIADLKKSISLGTSKINVNTENQMAFTKKVREILANDNNVYDPRKYIQPGRDAIKTTVINKIRIFGSSNKA
ncbi:class II fructose-1,6-bisphosphate aldolase [Bacillus massiliigorillae]|uniref:class II fructose-1,6-bisphosphate aldolase n=1 Tax=Bacillus massiliigorillae TaxID=1243664 RepID=UPI00039B528E|nr:class II fructose-1,6-bisphosphate aldolase [Bacillus massiliigorillae]